jgi:periplasmic protein CpxP/Spy
MKRSIFISMLFLLAFGFSANAQGGGGGFRMTPEERLQRIHAKLDSAFKLDAATMTKVDSVFMQSYVEQNKIREELMSGGGQPDFQVMREKMQPVMEARDAKLKPLLGEANFKIFKESIEPSMRGGGGRGN